MQYRRLIRGNSKLSQLPWTAMRRNPNTFVNGRICHPDHKTIVLADWHLVAMNTESLAGAMRSVAFLD